MSFRGKVAVVTGASSGIGWELARQLAGEGCKVGILARRQPLLEKLSAEITQAGEICAWEAVDAGERGAVVEAIRRLGEKLGPVDLLIANAGVGAPTLLDPMNVPDVDKMFRVNVLGLIYAIEAVLPEMLKRKTGHLAGVSSLAGYKGVPGESGYSAPKAAVNNFLEGLRIRLRGTGIAVTTICPGFVRTPMTEVNQFKMPYLLEADEAARRILWALRRRMAVFNFPWQMSLLMKLSAWLPDWLVARLMQNYNHKPPMPKNPL